MKRPEQLELNLTEPDKIKHKTSKKYYDSTKIIRCYWCRNLGSCYWRTS